MKFPNLLFLQIFSSAPEILSDKVYSSCLDDRCFRLAPGVFSGVSQYLAFKASPLTCVLPFIIS